MDGKFVYVKNTRALLCNADNACTLAHARASARSLLQRHRKIAIIVKFQIAAFVTHNAFASASRIN